MSANTYTDYSRDRIGWFFGLSGPQLAILAAASLPVFWALQQQAWGRVLVFLASFAVVFLVTVVSIQGRSAVGWLWASVCYLAASLTGARGFTALAAQGRADDLDDVDLPGVLQGVQVHDGPPSGPTQSRTALIQNHAARTWAVTAAIVHPGIGMSDAAERNRQAAGLTSLLDLASRGELIDEIIFMVRTVPDDGAERSVWVERHRVPEGGRLTRQVNNDLQRFLSGASVRTEAFVTIVVPETRIARDARQAGGGLEGRARVLYGLMGEVEAQMRASMAMTDVHWLTSPELALACRTGFAPADRASVVEALAERASNPRVNADVPWAMAGPSGADTGIRHYSHDSWDSVAATIKLPAKGAVIGALAPILTPAEPGERRSFMVSFPILGQAAAERTSDNAEFAAEMGDELRRQAGVKTKARHRNDASKVHAMDEKLARGNALIRPYAVCCVTVPRAAGISEFARRLDGCVRRSGFAPLRLDFAQDAGFAAATIPLGLGLTRRSDA
ncbi:MAG: PrgI family protein [Acidobacteriota bacterium]|nr:PrgI family protein [Acidobacteriota bacterium]